MEYKAGCKRATQHLTALVQYTGSIHVFCLGAVFTTENPQISPTYADAGVPSPVFPLHGPAWTYVEKYLYIFLGRYSKGIKFYPESFR